MNNVLKKHIEALQAEAEEYADLQEDVLVMKTDITVSALAVLISSLKETFDDFLVNASETKSYDEGLGKTIKESIAELVTVISKQPDINISPKISVDIQPLQSIASEISKQSSTLINLVQKLDDNDKDDELYKLILSLVTKQNAFLEREMKQIDYSNQLKSISEGVSKKNIVEKITITYGDGNRIKEMIPVYKK
jgi:hypothetical protein